MKTGGPKIMALGEGWLELGMLRRLKASRYNGRIGSIGHTENEDVALVPKRNIAGLQKRLAQSGETRALGTYE